MHGYNEKQILPESYFVLDWTYNGCKFDHSCLVELVGIVPGSCKGSGHLGMVHWVSFLAVDHMLVMEGAADLDTGALFGTGNMAPEVRTVKLRTQSLYSCKMKTSKFAF